jgi:hypothetical protein
VLYLLLDVTSARDLLVDLLHLLVQLTDEVRGLGPRLGDPWVHENLQRAAHTQGMGHGDNARSGCYMGGWQGPLRGRRSTASSDQDTSLTPTRELQSWQRRLTSVAVRRELGSSRSSRSTRSLALKSNAAVSSRSRTVTRQ